MPQLLGLIREAMKGLEMEAVAAFLTHNPQMTDNFT